MQGFDRAGNGITIIDGCEDDEGGHGADDAGYSDGLYAAADYGGGIAGECCGGAGGGGDVEGEDVDECIDNLSQSALTLSRCQRGIFDSLAAQWRMW